MDWIKLLTGGLNFLKKAWAFIKKQKATTIVIAILIAIIFLQRACVKPETIVDYRDVIVHDTTIITKDSIVYKDSIIKKLVPYGIEKWHYDTVWREVDTAAILSDYFAVKYFSDTLSNDTLLFAVSRYKVSQNELERQEFNYSIKRQQTLNHATTIINPPKNKIFLDLGLNGNLGTFGATAGVTYLDKRDKGYSYKYDFIHKTHHIGMSFKLFEYGKSE